MTETSERNGAGLIAASPASMAVLAIALLSGIGIVLLSASQAFAVLAGGLVLAIVLASPYAGLCLFCALAVVVPYTTVTLGRRIAVPELILAMTWLSVLWRVAAGSLSLRFGKTERAVLVLMAFSVIPLVAGEHALPDPGGRGPVLWARWLLDLSAVLLVPAIITERTQATRLLTILIGSAAVMVAISTAMFALTHRPDGILPFLDLANYGDLDKIASFYTGFPGRMGSPWLHPNALGGLLALLLPLAINRAMTARAGKHAAFVLIVLLLGLGLVLGGSRGATVSVALTVIWLVHARFRRGLVVALALAAVAVVVIGVRLPLFERLSEISPSDPSIAQRLDEYRAFPGYVASYPLGIGFVETVSFEADQPVETTSPPIGTSNSVARLRTAARPGRAGDLSVDHLSLVAGSRRGRPRLRPIRGRSWREGQRLRGFPDRVLRSLFRLHRRPDRDVLADDRAEPLSGARFRRRYGTSRNLERTCHRHCELPVRCRELLMRLRQRIVQNGGFAAIERDRPRVLRP